MSQSKPHILASATTRPNKNSRLRERSSNIRKNPKSSRAKQHYPTELSVFTITERRSNQTWRRLKHSNTVQKLQFLFERSKTNQSDLASSRARQHGSRNLVSLRAHQDESISHNVFASQRDYPTKPSVFPSTATQSKKPNVFTSSSTGFKNSVFTSAATRSEKPNVLTFGKTYCLRERSDAIQSDLPTPAYHHTSAVQTCWHMFA